MFFVPIDCQAQTRSNLIKEQQSKVPAGRESEQVVERFRIVAPGVGRRGRVQNHFSEAWPGPR